MIIPVPTDEKAIAALAQPMTKLIGVVSGAIGKLYEPVGTILQAKADGAAALIKAETNIEVRELQQRAMIRFLTMETERQKNIEAVVNEAQKALPPSVSDAPVEKDWAVHFFESVKDVSNGDVQKLWGRVLAGEVTQPGSTNQRTLNILKTMDKRDAEKFSEITRLSLPMNGSWLQFVNEDAINTLLASALGIPRTLATLNHLISIGLLAPEGGMVVASSLTDISFVYDSKKYRIIGPPKPVEKPGKLSYPERSLFIRSFSEAGQQLSRFVDPRPSDSFIPAFRGLLAEKLKATLLELPSEAHSGNTSSSSTPPAAHG